VGFLNVMTNLESGSTSGMMAGSRHKSAGVIYYCKKCLVKTT